MPTEASLTRSKRSSLLRPFAWSVFRLTAKATTKRKPKDVSAFLADVANEPKWQKDIVHVALTEGKAGVTGAKYERVQVVGGRNIKTINELVAHEPGKRVVYKAAGKVIEYALTFTLTTSDAGTTVDMAMEGEMLGFAAMFEGIATDELKAAMPGNMERLASTLDGKA